MKEWPSPDLMHAARSETLTGSDGEPVAFVALAASPSCIQCLVELPRWFDPQQSRRVADAMARAAMATLTAMREKDLPIPYTLTETAAQ